MPEKSPKLRELKDLIAVFRAAAVIGDNGYDASAFVQAIQAHDAQAVIPSRSNKKQPREFDANWYKDRNLIERFLNRLK